MKPIVDSLTMRALEEKAFSKKETVESLMDVVGEKLATFVKNLIVREEERPLVLLVAGKGNNGADGYTACLRLIEKQVDVVVWQVSPVPPGSLLEKRQQQFLSKGGVIFYDTPSVHKPFVIIDGIFGAGFKGLPDARSTAAILWINAQETIIISIDLPSGIDPNTGDVLGEAVQADYTCACHVPKKGCFLKTGWEHTGDIHVFSLPLDMPQSDMYLLEREDISPLLPKKKRMQNKFQAGSVIAVAGSLGMMGAASFSCEASYTVGAGYVRLLMSKDLQHQECILPREVVKTYSYKIDNLSFDSVLVGPGFGRTPEATNILDSLWPHFTVPTVVDADALFWLAQQKTWDVRGKVLTPHLGEASRLFRKDIRFIDETLLRELKSCTESTGCVIVLKGAPTFIISSNNPIFVMPRGDPGMATAGSGDVLSGTIAGFLAQKVSLVQACMLATWIHGLAGELSASCYTSYATTASSILRAIPSALSTFFKKNTCNINFLSF